MSRIKAHNLTVTAGSKTILDRVDLTVEDGEIVTVVGPNGSGKTTLMRSLIGALTPASGSIEMRKGTQIGYVPQKLDIDPTLPISVSRFLSLPRRKSDALIKKELGRVGLTGFENHQIIS